MLRSVMNGSLLAGIQANFLAALAECHLPGWDTWYSSFWFDGWSPPKHHKSIIYFIFTSHLFYYFKDLQFYSVIHLYTLYRTVLVVLKMLMVQCTLFIHINIITICQKIHLIWTEYNSGHNVHVCGIVLGRVRTPIAWIKVHHANHSPTKTYNSSLFSYKILSPYFEILL